MAIFWTLVISGAVSGAIYSIMSSALVLTCQTSGVFNFAQGAEAFAVAYCYYQLHTGAHLTPWLSALLSLIVFAPLMAVLFDLILLRRLASAPLFARIVGTIGLLVAVPAAALWIVETLCDGVFKLGLPTLEETNSAGIAVPGIGPTPPSVWHLGFLNLHRVAVTSDQISVFVAAALAAVVLWVVLKHSRIGLQMRATVDRRELSGLKGVNPARTSTVSWVLTMLIVGLGGVLIAPLFELDSNTITLVVFGALPAVALAGLRSIPIAFVSGLVIGVGQNLLAGYGHDFLPGAVVNLTGFRPSLPFLLTVVLLFFLGRNRDRQAGSMSSEIPRPDHRAGLPAWRRALPWVLVTAGYLAFTFHVRNFTSGAVLAPGLAIAVVLLSFVVVTGLGGMVSLAQATFVTVGGFMAGWLSTRHFGFNLPLLTAGGHLNFFWATLAAGVAAAAVGVVIALPVRRLGAIALALGTFALALAADLTLWEAKGISNGQSGYSFGSPKLSIDGFVIFNFVHPRQEVIVLMLVFGLFALLARNLEHSPSGRAILAVRSSQTAAGTSGIVAGRVQITVFAVSAGIAGVGGALIGVTNSSFTNSTTPALTALVWLAAAVTFGIRRPGGAFLAGLVVSGTTQLFDTIAKWSWVPHDFGVLTTSTYFPMILFGLGAVNLAMNPDGVLALLAERKRTFALGGARRQRSAPEAPDVPPELRVFAAAAGGGEQATTPPAIALDNVTAGYGDVEVIHSVSLCVPAGSVVALLGANGAGKSTLCGVASGLVRPKSGRVLINGEDVTELPSHARVARGLLLVPEARGVFPSLSVEENLEISLRHAPERDAVYDRFSFLGERRMQLAGSLSGGEQQILALASALVRTPRVLIADEPTLGLAPQVIREVLDALDEIRRLGCTILLVEERAAEAVALADSVGFIERGRLLWVRSSEEVNYETLGGAYLGAAVP